MKFDCSFGVENTKSQQIPFLVEKFISKSVDWAMATHFDEIYFTWREIELNHEPRRNDELAVTIHSNWKMHVNWGVFGWVKRRQTTQQKIHLKLICSLTDAAKWASNSRTNLWFMIVWHARDREGESVCMWVRIYEAVDVCEIEARTPENRFQWNNDFLRAFLHPNFVFVDVGQPLVSVPLHNIRTELCMRI